MHFYCCTSWANFVSSRRSKFFAIFQLITIKCFSFLNSSDILHFSFTHFFTNNNFENKGKCYSMWLRYELKLLEAYLIFTSFPTKKKRKLTWLGDEPGQRISKLFDIHYPNHRRRWRLDDEPLIVPPTFISGDEDGRRRLSPRFKPSLRGTFVFSKIFSTNRQLFLGTWKQVFLKPATTQMFERALCCNLANSDQSTDIVFLLVLQNSLE